MGAPRCFCKDRATKLASVASGSLELEPQVLQTRLDGVGCNSFARSVERATNAQPWLRERVRREEIHPVLASQSL